MSESAARRNVHVVGSDGSVLRDMTTLELTRDLLRPAIQQFETADAPIVKDCEACGRPTHVPAKGVIPRICMRCRRLMGQRVCAGYGERPCPVKSKPRHVVTLPCYIIARKGQPWRCAGCTNEHNRPKLREGHRRYTDAHINSRSAHCSCGREKTAQKPHGQQAPRLRCLHCFNAQRRPRRRKGVLP